MYTPGESADDHIEWVYTPETNICYSPQKRKLYVIFHYVQAEVSQQEKPYPIILSMLKIYKIYINIYAMLGIVVIVIVWLLNLQLPM